MPDDADTSPSAAPLRTVDGALFASLYRAGSSSTLRRFLALGHRAFDGSSEEEEVEGLTLVNAAE